MKSKTVFYIIMIVLAICSDISLSQVDLNQNKKHHKRNFPLIRDTYSIPKFPRSVPLNPSGPSAVFSVIKQDFWFTLRDSVKLDCSRFFPSEPNPFLPNGYPCVIMVHGYGDRKETLEGFANAQAAYGFVVYTYSVRGQGNSGGLSNLISTTEAQDLIEFVNFIRQDFQTGLDTSKILITGGSQGGTVPYIAASTGNLKVKTIISALTSPEFASSWIENGSIKMTFLWTIDYNSDTARYSPQVLAMRSWVYSGSPDKWDSLVYWVPYERNFTNTITHNSLPILVENAWQDKFFNAKGSINCDPYINAPKRYYFGAVRGHGGDYSTTEDIWHENFFNEWYYYWIDGVDNGILTRPRYHFAYTTFPDTNGMWTFVHDSSYVWPPNGSDNFVLFFRNGGSIQETPGTDQVDSLVNNVNPGYTMLNAVDDEFKGANFTANFKKATKTYNSAVLAQDVQMIGTPQIRFDYLSNASECQFNFQIYEVSGTKVKLVTRVNYTDRKNIVNTRKNVIFEGISHGHIFRAGNRIRIVLTNLDTAPDDTSFLASNPHVLPDLVNGTSKIFYSGNCFINIPIIGVGSKPLSRFVTNSTPNLNSVIQENNPIPKEFNLNQNYPNPFNPVTTINYSIPLKSFVTLKVYDISGRVVATLVNNETSPGYYSVKFNSVTYGLSSGIYFYKISAGSFVSVKKLVLIK
jgi:predicted acyl esterase